jgi:hypothetical protein
MMAVAMDEESHLIKIARRLRQESEKRAQQEAAPRAGSKADAGRVGQTIAGSYRLLRRLGRGRLGDIYEACAESDAEARVEPTVALQLLDRRIAADTALLEKLRRGYAALRASPHRNIVDLTDFVSDDETGYLVMEMLDGASLRFVLDDQTQLPLSEVLAVIRAVGEALKYLHAKTMVHGRLTPDSVFITENYEVKLLDIVPARPPSILPAPAGARRARDAEPPSQKDDIFGLACLAYELATGKHPYNWLTASEAAAAGLAPEPIQSMSPVRWQALARGLSLASDQRTSTITALLQDLGISGAERLGPASPSPAPSAERRAPPTIVTASDRLSAMDPAVESAGGRWFRRFAFLVVLAGLTAGIWVYRDPIRDLAVERFAAIVLDLPAVLGGNGEGQPADESLPAARADEPLARSDEPAPLVPEADEAGTTAESEIDPDAAPELDPVPEPDAAAVTQSEPEPDAAAVTQQEPDTDAVAPPDAEPDSASGAEAESVAATETEAAADSVPESELETAADEPAEALGPPRFVVTDSVIRVRETQAFVAIPVRREGPAGMSATIVWWSSEESALAGDDYADFGEVTEEFGPEERERTLIVPLINDGLVEPLERFLVGIGRRDPDTGRIELIANVSVDIVDDD